MKAGSFFSNICAVVEKLIGNFLDHISLNCDASRDSAVTKVANVSTGTFWLDTPEIDACPKFRTLWTNCDKSKPNNLWVPKVLDIVRVGVGLLIEIVGRSS